MSKLRKRLYKIIFESDTRAGKIFDEVLIGVILLSIFVVILESYSSLRAKYANVFNIVEWSITFIFTIEYILRIWVTNRPVRYILSFYGLIDLLTLLPSYLGLFFAGGRSLVVIRLLRVLRVFRILKMSGYTKAGRQITEAIKESKEKISVFIVFVLILSIIIGTIMYLIEGEANGFTDIPTSVYWAIVTLTTVGYGDLSPVSSLGKFFASMVMILGYSILAVPTGIITANLINKSREINNTKVCPNCLYDKHDDDSKFCKKCGAPFEKIVTL